MLSARGIWKSYGVTGGRLEVLRGLELEVERGEIVVILGVSGSGKSTLLHILGTLDKPDSGELMIKGNYLQMLSESELNRIRNRDIGFIFQFHYLLPEFDALENVMLPAYLRGGNRGFARERASELLKEVGLDARVSHRPAELSGGEQQRVAVARALMNNPKIVFADEPSGNLDEGTSDSLHKLIDSLSKTKGQTFVIVTHKKSLLKIADRAMLLENGKLSSLEVSNYEMSDM